MNSLFLKLVYICVLVSTCACVYIYVWTCMYTFVCICVYMHMYFLVALSNKKAKKERAVRTLNCQILISKTRTSTKEPEILRELVDCRPGQGIYQVNLYHFPFWCTRSVKENVFGEKNGSIL